MRIWDVSPGYLNRQSLLGEHRELHGIYEILTSGKQGYARHPETVRWTGALTGLVCRHRQLASEMQLRGYTDRTPLESTGSKVRWPDLFVTPPAEQIALLKQKYAGKGRGRIGLPINRQELWAQHKYSVMARSPEIYRRLGRSVARSRARAPLSDLVVELIQLLRERPDFGPLANAIEHMWGHVKRCALPEDVELARKSPAHALERIRVLAVRGPEPYLLASTALCELTLYV